MIGVMAFTDSSRQQRVTILQRVTRGWLKLHRFQRLTRQQADLAKRRRDRPERVLRLAFRSWPPPFPSRPKSTCTALNCALRRRGCLNREPSNHWPGRSSKAASSSPASPSPTPTAIDKGSFVDPNQFPEGIEAVMVNGAFALVNGMESYARSGAILRRS